MDRATDATPAVNSAQAERRTFNGAGGTAAGDSAGVATGMATGAATTGTARGAVGRRNKPRTRPNTDGRATGATTAGIATGGSSTTAVVSLSAQENQFIVSPRWGHGPP